MTIIVTGAAGFIGYHVARALLARGESVVGIDNLNPYYDPQLKQDRLAELREAERGRIPLRAGGFLGSRGARSGARRRADRPHRPSRRAGRGPLFDRKSARLCFGQPRRAISTCSSWRAIAASGISSMPPPPPSTAATSSLPFRVEDRVDHPISLYAATKKADELMSETYAHLYRTPLTGLRFFTVYGPWGRPDMAMWIFTRKILAGEPIQVFNHGRMRRDFTFIDDIVAGVVACLDNPPRRRRRRQGRRQRRAAPALQYRQQPLRRPDADDRAARAGLRAQGDLELLPMQPGDVPETLADICAIQADLGFAPATPISAGVPAFRAMVPGLSSRGPGERVTHPPSSDRRRQLYGFCRNS